MDLIDYVRFKEDIKKILSLSLSFSLSFSLYTNESLVSGLSSDLSLNFTLPEIHLHPEVNFLFEIQTLYLTT